MTSGDVDNWDTLMRRCEDRGLLGDAMFAEILRTMTKPRIKGEPPSWPPVRQAPPEPGEVGEHPVSEPEFVELAGTSGTPRVWQNVPFDQPPPPLRAALTPLH